MKNLRDLVYGTYERRLERKLGRARVPRHVGVVLDGNRRWAKAGGSSTAQGHQRGADKIGELLRWCDEVGVEVVTLWLLSTENVNRDEAEVTALTGIIEETVQGLAATGRYRVHPVGAPDVLPEHTRDVLKQAEQDTCHVNGLWVNTAVGYGGRREITDAVRSMMLEQADAGVTLPELAENLTVEHISEHLYTRGQPDPDLLIRTSGEQRLSGFLMWQSAHSEFYFCEAYWPAFRRTDFLRAIRNYAERHRRYGN